MAGVSTTPIVALDVDSLGAALSLVDRLAGAARYFKVGSELFTRAGPEVVATLRARDYQVFLDLKLHDIPHTVARGVAAASDLGVAMTTVHTSGGSAMLHAAVQSASPNCLIVGVSVLTSLDAQAIAAIWGRPDDLRVDSEVVRLARMATDSGLGGLVCSGHEVAPVRQALGKRLKLVVPGVRFADSAGHDQARIVTPATAAEAGVEYIVVGRAVTAAADPAAAMERLKSELAAVLNK